ncbi:carboxylesterase/lipase family protein [Pseudokordiimonas caeni]|uniref:carboxylesterase/lipase family protein n=1 Tax=Pseudokordiimonas caeni TaxID=2997908 RepID=UPI0028120831|nr:carboxylesterase family protein [Pseudokordiimonas caeni]
MTKHPDDTSNDHMGRRAFLKGAAVLAGAAAGAASGMGGVTAAEPAYEKAKAGRDRLVAKTGAAIVETQYGKVGGYIRNGIFTFKGMPYGASTGGENRFRAPEKPQPWAGVRSSLHYGLIAPQDKGMGRFHDESAFIFQWNDSVAGEDCLRVNVWTPGIRDNGRRPVMVWLHGGGFVAGSGHDLPAFDGENLASRGDVVVVTLNHRLNLLGYLDLSGYGDRYARSGNVGMLDIVAALEWVRDNIAEFGGDPDRVMIFGQSGGGAKVSALMGMPAAKGLFHRAVVQSGSFTNAISQDMSRRLADLLVAELGLNRQTVDELQAMPYDHIRLACDAVMQRENAPFPGYVDVRQFALNLNFAPVADGAVIPAAPFGPTAPGITADVPMMIGTTLNEFINGVMTPGDEGMDEAGLAAKVEAMFPGQGSRIVQAFRAHTPDASPFDLWSRIATSPVRQAAIDQAASKAALGKAPAYLYSFNWQPPVLDGRPRAFHCLDIPFVFANTDRCDTMTGGGPRAEALGNRMADAWIAFARTGNPNHAGIPDWKPYEPVEEPCMIWDDAPRLAFAPDRDELRSIKR